MLCSLISNLYFSSYHESQNNMKKEGNTQNSTQHIHMDLCEDGDRVRWIQLALQIL